MQLNARFVEPPRKAVGVRTERRLSLESSHILSQVYKGLSLGRSTLTWAAVDRRLSQKDPRRTSGGTEKWRENGAEW